MRYIEILPLENGSHENMIFDGNEFDVPDTETWAVIPDDMSLPESYPFVDLVTNLQTYTDGVEEKQIHVVVSMIEKDKSQIPVVEVEPSIMDDMMAMIVDQEYRLTLLEAKG